MEWSFDFTVENMVEEQAQVLEIGILAAVNAHGGKVLSMVVEKGPDDDITQHFNFQISGVRVHAALLILDLILAFVESLDLYMGGGMSHG
jgi:hypothetical protein